MSKTIYIYAWGNNEKRASMKGRECICLIRGKMNSCLIQFTDNNQKEITSRNALRRKNKMVTQKQRDKIISEDFKKIGIIAIGCNDFILFQHKIDSEQYCAVVEEHDPEEMEYKIMFARTINEDVVDIIPAFDYAPQFKYSQENELMTLITQLDYAS